jgi:HD-like signal output (HDOD) protein
MSKIETMPSLPTVVMELIKLIDNPMSSVNQVEKLLSKDQGLSLKVLRLANSAYYAVPGGAKTITRAVTFLGYNTVKQIIVSASVFEMFKKLSSDKFDLAAFWKHSVGVAILSEAVAKNLKKSTPEEVFISGLVHDMGKLALLMIDKNDFIETVDFALKNNFDLHKAELERGAPRHTYWGSELAKKWKLPINVQTAIRDHHSLNIKMRMTQDVELNQEVDIVYVANKLIHVAKFGNSGHQMFIEPEQEVMTRLGLVDKTKWNPWVEEAISNAESFAKILVES